MHVRFFSLVRRCERAGGHSRAETLRRARPSWRQHLL